MTFLGLAQLWFRRPPSPEVAGIDEKLEDQMIKVMWLLKRAPHLSLEEFGQWWMNVHAADIVADQAPGLRKYMIDLRLGDDSSYAGRPAQDSPWDGIAEQYFETVEDYNAVYSRTDRPTRADTLAHTSAFERLVVREYEVAVDGPDAGKVKP